MKMPKELLDQLSDEIVAELEERSQTTGNPITFDDMEEAVLLLRQKIGQKLMQNVVDKHEDKESEKKTAHAAD